MKTILITGGTSGIGKALVEYFDQKGFQVFFTARNAQKAEVLANSLNNSSFYLMDYTDFETIVSATNKIKEDVESLDLLINNAGTWQMKFLETQNGIETNFAVNHLASMLLTLELLPLLEKAVDARIINTSSGAHRRNILDFSDLEFRDKEYNGIYTYSQSKLCNILFSLELGKRLRHTNIDVNTVHPGYVKTSLFENMKPRTWSGVPDATHGARSAIYAALSDDLKGKSGKYIYLEQEDSNLSSLAKNEIAAKTLWTTSMEYLTPYLTTITI